MSIIIKGMKMPTSCSECKIRIALGCCGTLPHNTIVPTCPVIELPPHGRLIDADALIIALMDRGVEGIQTDDLSEIQQVIMDATTIIEAEEKE